MRKLCWFAAPFCAAVFAEYLLPAAALLPVSGGLVLLALLAGFGRRVPAVLACAGLAAGLLWCACYGALFRAPAQRLDNRILPFQATVADWPYETAVGGAGVTVWLEADGESVKTLLYTGEEGLALSPGDRVSGTAQFARSNDVRGEASGYYEAKGVFLRAYGKGALTVEPAGRVPVWAWPDYLSRALKTTAAGLCPEDAAGLLTALLTGDKSTLDSGDYALLRRAGAAHTVAVSGMHLSILAGMLGGLLFWCRRRVRAGIILGVLLFFAAAVGNTPSVLRAVFLYGMTQLAPLLGREEDKPTTLCAILFLLLAWNPCAAASVGLQLSFGAVAGIYLVTEPLYQKLTAWLSKGGPWYRRLGRRAFRFVAASLSATLGALLLTTPLTAVHFGTVSLLSPLTNLLILWAVSGAFCLGLLALLAGMVLPLAVGRVLVLPAVWLSRSVLAVTGALGRLPFASVNLDSPALRLGLTAVYGIVLLALLLRRGRPLIPVCAGVCILWTALLVTGLSLLFGPLTVTVFGVGQGQCILLASRGYTALIDCGGNLDNAGDLAADYLQTLGVSRLDLLVLTHFHDDHTNGVPELFARLEVSALAVPDVEDETGYRAEILDLAAQEETEVTFVTGNMAVNLGESVLTLYAPLGDGGENEEGLFVLATCGSFDLLITGDANQYVEQRLVKYGNLPDVEVLIAGHHGSKYSSSPALLDAAAPETAVISTGYNTYGHPAPETLLRLAERDIAIYRTDLMGNITIQGKGD